MAITEFTLIRGKYTIDKDPQARKLYGWSLAAECAAQSATIDTVTVYDSNGIDITDNAGAPGSPFASGTTAAVWISGGDASVANFVTLEVVLSTGHKDQRTLWFKMVQQ